MKTVKTTTIGVLLCMFIFTASAQTAKEVGAQYKEIKPKLFKTAPERMQVKLNQFDYLFNYEVGKTVSLPLAAGFLLNGTIVSKAEDAAANVKSIVIRSSDQAGAAFTLSRTLNENNTVSYRGRMFSFKHDDGYEIELDNGSYFMVKKNSSDIYEE